MRQAEIYYKAMKAGVLTEVDDDEDIYHFKYNEEYLKSAEAEPICLTMPLREEEYRNQSLLPFFDGLIPEGWTLDVALRNTDISILDRMGLLLLCCKDCIGAVSVVKI